MNPSEEYLLLLKRLRRGVIMFRVAFLCFIGLSALALLIPQYRHFAIDAFLMSVMFTLGMTHGYTLVDLFNNQNVYHVRDIVSA